MTNLEAVIEIGSTGVRLLVAEVLPDHKWNILDRSGMPLSLGRDVFLSGFVQRTTLSECIQILLRYKEQLSGWGINTTKVAVVATAALREARNSDPVIDRIFVKTGFKVRIIDGIEENRLMYLAVTECLKDESVNVRNEDAIILEVGGGSSEMMLIKKGKMAGAHSLHLGTARIERQIPMSTGSLDDAKRYIKEFVLNSRGSFNEELNLANVKQFIAVGSEPSIAAYNNGKPISTWLWEITRKDFEKFVNQIQNYSVEECVARFKISYNDAQQLHIGLLIYNMFIQLTNVDKIIVPETNIRNGLIISKIETPDTELQQEFYSQIVASAFNLLRKYHGDEKHALYVSRLSLQLFDILSAEIGLGERARMLMEVGAILHDIGMFIRLDTHNLHGAYIITNSEIFGLNRSENTVLAEMSKYHRGSLMPQDDDHFQMIPRDTRMTILKLTAILRIADALDRAHTQKLTDVVIIKQNDSLIINTKGNHNTILEKRALVEKADMFESIFGYKVVLS